MPCLFLTCPRHSTSRFASASLCTSMVESLGIREMPKKIKLTSSPSFKEGIPTGSPARRGYLYYRRNARSASRRGQLRALQTRRLSRYKQSRSKTKTRTLKKLGVWHPASVGDVKRRKTHPFPPAAGRRRRRERMGTQDFFAHRVRHLRITSAWPAIGPKSHLSLSLSGFRLPSLSATRPQSNTL
jgi:hypothetical protein